MRSALLAAVAGAGGLLAAGMLGVASAEAPSTPANAPVRTVSVEGIASQSIAQGANSSTANGIYREAMASAENDAHGKAEVLASKAGATLGNVQSIVENGGSISCSDGTENGYVEYQGEQADFGWPNPGGTLRTATPLAPSSGKPAIKRRSTTGKPRAKKATSAGCTLYADVALAYSMS